MAKMVGFEPTRPCRPIAFRVELVMTASIRLHLENIQFLAQIT